MLDSPTISSKVVLSKGRSGDTAAKDLGVILSPEIHLNFRLVTHDDASKATAS